MLELILGRSGFGKTEYIRKLALKECQARRVILLLPDQMTFEAEGYFLKNAGAATAAKIEVFSFARLCEDVFKNYGGISEKRVTDIGRTLLMSLAVGACKDSLTLYQNSAKEDKLTSLLLTAVEEFKAQGITPESLGEIAKGLSGGLKNKTEEIARIYSVFETLLKDTYIEPWDMLTRAAKILEENNYFDGALLLIDGFEGMSHQRVRIIAAALKNCFKVCCTACCDNLYSDDETSIFAPIRAFARELIATAKENGKKVLPPVELKKPWRFENAAIRAIEEKLFATHGAEKINEQGVMVYAAPNVYTELEFVAATIRRHVISGGSYGDVRVICRNGKNYTGLIDSVFERYEIPVFAARPRRADSAPLMRFVLAALDSAEYGLKSENVLIMLKTGLCGVWGTELSDLENYIFTWRITGSMWKNSFTKSPDGFGKGENTKEAKRIDQLRIKAISPLLKFIEDTKKASATEISAAIYNLLLGYGAEEKVLENIEKLEERSAFEQAAEQGRIWKELMELLDLFAVILGGEIISRKRYTELLRTVLAKDEAMDLPLRQDTVVFGTADQLKSYGKITFLIGAVQGEFPQTTVESGIFTQGERSVLCQNALPLNKDTGKEALLERYYAYAAACSGSQRLYVSYYISDGAGQTAPSELVSRILNIVDTKTVKNLKPEYFANSKNSVVSAAARTFLQNTPEGATFRLLAKDSKQLKRATQVQDFKIKDKRVASQLFSGKTFSPSQVETYHRCAFQYLCKYGLRAKERRTAEIDVLEYGTLMHYIFENLISCFDLTKGGEAGGEKELEEFILKLIDNYAAERMGGAQGLSGVDKYRFKRMADTALILATRLMKELAQSKFKPEYLELDLSQSKEFSPLEVKLENGTTAFVSGVVDRVDVYDSPRGRYIRVVDYKTGHKEFKLCDVLMGLSLQMLIYLSALSKNGCFAAGALYMPSANPTVSAKKGMTLEKTWAERDKKMCMNGVVLDDLEIMAAMEANLEGKFIPIKKTATGKYSKPDSALTGEELEKLFSYTRKLISTMVTELCVGETAPEPTFVNGDSCAWCPYISVCGRENHERQSLSMDNKEVFEIIEKKEGSYEDMD